MSTKPDCRYNGCLFLKPRGDICGVVPRKEGATLCAKHEKLPMRPKNHCKVESCKRLTLSKFGICSQHQREGYRHSDQENISVKLCSHSGGVNRCRKSAIDSSSSSGLCAFHSSQASLLNQSSLPETLVSESLESKELLDKEASLLVTLS